MTRLNRQNGIHIGLFILLILALLIILAPRMADGAVEGGRAIEIGKLIPPSGESEFGRSVALDCTTTLVGDGDVACVFVDAATGRQAEQAALPETW